MSSSDLQSKIESLPATSAQTIKKLKSLGINTFWDLLNYFPFRYEDYTATTIKGKVIKAKQLYTKRGFKIQKVTLSSQDKIIELSWFNQPYLLTILEPGLEISVAGEIEEFGRKLTIEPKEYEVLKQLDQETIHTGRLVPVYPQTWGLSSRTIREKIFYILKILSADTNFFSTWDSATTKSGGFPRSKKNSVSSDNLEFLPKSIISDNNLLDENTAYQNIHFPKSKMLMEQSRQRLSFDEIFAIQLSSALVKKDWQKEKVSPHSFKVGGFKSEMKNFINKLPFELTGSQKKVVKEILADLEKPQPMNRFLQGEVGSGKTVVATIVCYIAHLNGFRSLFMAPTEILATQHYNTLSKFLGPFGLNTTLLTSGSRMSNLESRISNKSKIQNSRFKIQDSDIIIGTHALLAKKLAFEKVGFVVIDEQHRFGVAQRAQLKNKGINPHLLTMTATPIPRTVALTLYGELDISMIDEMPVGRIPIKTYLVPKHKRDDGYDWIKEKINKDGAQVFIVCPLIEESPVETMQSVKAASQEFQNLKTNVFKDFSIALLHGRLKSAEKNQIMQDFKDKKYNILVSTSVVEVGVDIPNATIMLIEGAERFGLAQLHQLRGRVGRGSAQSYCLLYTGQENPNVTHHLKFFSSTNNGAQLAEYDLKRRGPGEIYGTRQHGYSDLKIASLSDYELIEKTKSAVDHFQKNYQLDQFPNLQTRLASYQTHLIAHD